MSVRSIETAIVEFIKARPIGTILGVAATTAGGIFLAKSSDALVSAMPSSNARNIGLLREELQLAHKERMLLEKKFDGLEKKVDVLEKKVNGLEKNQLEMLAILKTLSPK
jgi:hypothetical protein